MRIALGLAFALLTCHSEAQELADGERQLEEGRTTLDASKLLTAHKILEDCMKQSARNAICSFDLGRTDLYLSRVEDLRKNRKAAERWLDSAFETTKRSLEIDGQRAETHALLADLYGTRIGYGGALAGMRYGSRAEAEIQRALQLDPHNAYAYTVTGRKQLYAPKMFGGDPEKAIESFRKATEFNARYDEGFVWLAIAYKKKGDSARAQAALGEALRLNSRSAFAKRIQPGAPD